MKKLKEKIINWWFKVQEQYRTLKQDKKIKKLFPKLIQEEVNDPESVFNQYNLRTLNDFTQVVQIIDIPEEYQLKGQQWQIMDKLNENTYFIDQYLRKNLNIQDNLDRPEYYHIEDPSSNTPLSCRYLAIWKYKPVLTSKKTIYTINSIISVFTIGLITGLCFILI
jgi:hypothetical protein